MSDKEAALTPEIADRLAACIEIAADRAPTQNQVMSMRLVALHVRELAAAAQKAGLCMEINWHR